MHENALAPPLPPRVCREFMSKPSSSAFHVPADIANRQLVPLLQHTGDFIGVCVTSNVDSLATSVLDNYDDISELENGQVECVCSVPGSTTEGDSQHCWTTLQHFHLSPSHRSSTLSRIKSAVTSSLRQGGSSSLAQHSTPCSPSHYLPMSSAVDHNLKSLDNVRPDSEQINHSSISDVSPVIKSHSPFSPIRVAKFTVVRDYIEESTDGIGVNHCNTAELSLHKTSFHAPPSNNSAVIDANGLCEEKADASCSPFRTILQPPPTPKRATQFVQAGPKARQSLSSKESDEVSHKCDSSGSHATSSDPQSSFSSHQQSFSSRLWKTSQHLGSRIVNSLRRVLPNSIRSDHNETVSPMQKSSSIFHRLRTIRKARDKSSSAHGHDRDCRENWTVSASPSPVCLRRKCHKSELIFAGQGKRRSASASELNCVPHNQQFSTEVLVESDHFIEVFNQETYEHDLAERVDPQSLLNEEVRQSRVRLHRCAMLTPTHHYPELAVPPLPPRQPRPVPPPTSSNVLPLPSRTSRSISHDTSDNLPSEIPILTSEPNQRSENTPPRSSPVHAAGQERLFPTIVENMNRLKKMGWYWGPLTVNEAKTLLLRYRDGTFLIRDSEHETYLLSASFKARGRVFHARINFFAGEFFLANQPEDPRSPSFHSFLELLVQRSITGDMHFFSQPLLGHIAQGAGAEEEDVPHNGVAALGEEVAANNTQVALLYPLSRFSIVQTLTHLCRFEILLHVRHDHIDQLPLPEPMKCYLRQSQYCTDLSLLHCYTGDDGDT